MITIPDDDFTAYLIIYRWAESSEDKQFRYAMKRDVKEWYFKVVGSRCAYEGGVGA